MARNEPTGSSRQLVRELVIPSSRDRDVPRPAGQGSAAANQQRSPVIAQASVETLRGGAIGRNYSHVARPDTRGPGTPPPSETSRSSLYWGSTNSLVQHGGVTGSVTSRIERRHSVCGSDRRRSATLCCLCCYQLRSPATVPKAASIQKRLDAYASWHNLHRPHEALGRLTPTEAALGLSIPAPMSYTEGDELEPIISSRRQHVDRDPRLLFPVIKVKPKHHSVA